jgi:hypothetical protein
VGSSITLGTTLRYGAVYSAVSGFSPKYRFEPYTRGSVTFRALKSLQAVTRPAQGFELDILPSLSPLH